MAAPLLSQMCAIVSQLAVITTYIQIDVRTMKKTRETCLPNQREIVKNYYFSISESILQCLLIIAFSRARFKTLSVSSQVCRSSIGDEFRAFCGVQCVILICYQRRLIFMCKFSSTTSGPVFVEFHCGPAFLVLVQCRK